MPLTDVQVRNAKSDAKPRKLADSNGLYLYISTAGGKSWRLDYSFFGKRKTVTFGTYPALGLAEARGLRDEAKRQLTEGLVACCRFHGHRVKVFLLKSESMNAKTNIQSRV